MAYKNLELEKTKQLCQKVFASYGFLPEDCDRITDILLTADLFGIESHGIQRLIRYYNELSWNLVDANAKLEIVKETPVSAMIDAHGMMGQVAAYHGMEMAIADSEGTALTMTAGMRGSKMEMLMDFQTPGELSMTMEMDGTYQRTSAAPASRWVLTMDMP